MSATAEEQELNFEHELPAGMNSFSLLWLANFWGCSLRHVFNLVESGAFGPGAVDLRNIKSSRSMIRLPRKTVVEFLNNRQKLEAIAEQSPQPKPRKEFTT